MKYFIKVFNIIFFNEFFVKIFNLLLLNKSSIIFFNIIYERSPHILQEAFVRLAKPPDFDFNWKILLPNKKEINVNVCKNYVQSYHFALSYKWHDKGLRKVETLLNNFYDPKYLYFDIGANHGLRSIYALSIGRPVILFEPNHYLNNFLKKLFNANSFNNYKLENLCLSNKEGVQKFYISSSTYLSSLNKDNALMDAGSKEQVKEIDVNLTSLDKYFQNAQIDNEIKIIKIDVEGHEYEVIMGAKSIIENYSPAIIIEILPSTKSGVDLFEFFFKTDYKCFIIPNRGRSDLIEITKSNYKNKFNSSNYLFIKNPKPVKNLKIKSG